jgi:hypothetical protein
MAEMPVNLESLGIAADLEEGQMIIDAVLVARVVSAHDQHTRLLVCNTPGMDWIVQVGLLTAALNADDDSSIEREG